MPSVLIHEFNNETEQMNGSFQVAGGYFPELARLQEHLDEMFRPSGAANIRAQARGSFPAVNVGTTPETVEVLAFVPGVDPKALQITIDRGLLVIAGERENEVSKRNQGASMYAQERFIGSFRRVISLPEEADPTKVEAKYRDGVLQISVTRRESSKPRQIAVN
jgi:HSP20 family protein